MATDLLSAVEALLPRRRLFPLKKQLSRTRRVKDPTIDDVRHNQNYSCHETANQLPHPTRGSAWPTYASPAAARPRSRAAHSAPVKLCPLGTRARRLHPTQPLKLDPRCNRTRVGSRLLRASWGGVGLRRARPMRAAWPRTQSMRIIAKGGASRQARVPARARTHQKSR